MRHAFTLASTLALVACGGETGPAGMDSGPPPSRMDAGALPQSDAGPCPAGDPLIAPELLPLCELAELPGCTAARCVLSTLVPEDFRDLLADCDATNKCVPDEYIRTNGNFLPATCRSVNDAEGRCVSVCLPDVAAQADLLPRATCAEGALCVPCYDPTTGEETGACSLACDSGPTEPPVVFEGCCHDLGSCVDASIVPAEQQGLLGPDSCTAEGALCAPNDLTDTSFVPPACRSVANAEGRCLPDCLPDVASQAALLPRADCAELHLCVPCFDPITGEPTGACDLNGDMPSEPPVTFDNCCGDRGICVPPTAVPEDQRDLLGPDTCAGDGDLCAPTDLTDSTFIPASCDSVAGAEGRCLPDCLPDVAAQADLLPQDTCLAAELCVPCFDPITGEPTGACDLNGDMPSEPPVAFDHCCHDLGHCVPSSVVPVDQRDQLGPETCTDADALCAPDDLTDPTFRPPTCTFPGGREARCLPDCLPDVAAQAGTLTRETCAEFHLCVPCYDPFTGASTGACELNGDAPSDPPMPFESCCDGAATCVPASLVPDDQEGSLDQDSCTSGADLCVPDNYTTTPPTPFPACNTGNLGIFVSADGACVPTCIADNQFGANLLFGQRTCASNELCVACWTLLTGNTGACDPP